MVKLLTFTLLSLYFTVPAPTVNIVAIGNQTVGSSVSLKCDITAVKGINGSVSIIWMKNDKEVLRENDKTGNSTNTSALLLYTSLYNITLLKMMDDDTTYHCQAVISTSPSVNNSDNFTLNVIGE